MSKDGEDAAKRLAEELAKNKGVIDSVEQSRAAYEQGGTLTLDQAFPKKRIEMGALVNKVVRVVGANGEGLFVGKAVSYQPRPSYSVELEDGQLLSFPADKCEEADETVRGLFILLREAMKKIAERK